MAWFRTQRAPNGDLQIDPRERAIRAALLADGFPMGRRLREMPWPRVVWEIFKAVVRASTRGERPLWDLSPPHDTWTHEAYEDAVAGERPDEPSGQLLPWYRRVFAAGREGSGEPPPIETYRS